MGKNQGMKRVELNFIDEAPVKLEVTVELECDAQRAFDVLGDASAWPRWMKLIRRVDWPEEDRGVGATRTVHLVGGAVAVEEFLAWEPPRRMSFRFNSCQPGPGLSALAEDYRIEDVGAGRSRLQWTMALDMGKVGNFMVNLGKKQMRSGTARMMGGLASYIKGLSN